MLDFRSVRYKKKHMFDEEAEFLSEFEEQAQEEKNSAKQSMIDLSEKIEPINNSPSAERKVQKTEKMEDALEAK